MVLLIFIRSFTPVPICQRIETLFYKSLNILRKETFEMAQEVSFYYCSISRDIFQNTTTEKPIDTEKGYRELLNKSQDGTFNPTFLNKCSIGGCDARKIGYTEQFIDRLLEQNRCLEIFNHGGKGRKFIIVKE